MDKQTAVGLLRAVWRVRSIGHGNSHFDGINDMVAFKLRESRYSWKDALETWNEPGLFVADDDVVKSPKPLIFIMYKMACGELRFIVLPKAKRGHWPVEVLPGPGGQRGCFNPGLPGEFGAKIPFGLWLPAGHFGSYYKRAGTRQAHFVRKTRGEAEERSNVL